ncbi:MAG: Flp family type IVb pilin [Chloroflexota bacterium]
MLTYLRTYLRVKMRPHLKKVVRDERGLETAEWALLLVGIAIVIAGVVKGLGGRIQQIFNEMISNL